MTALPPAGVASLPLRVVRTLRAAALRFHRDLGFEKAASLAYSSLLAVVPAALLAVSVVELLDAKEQLAVADQVLELLFPPEARDVREGFHRFLEESRQVFLEDRTAGSVRIFSMLTLVYFAGKLLQSVDSVVSAVWGGGGFRYFLRRLSAYWAVITLGPILLALSFTATALAGTYLGEAVGALVARTLPFLVTWVSVFLFYRLMPHGRVRARAALAGAIVTGTLWEASKLALGWYLSRPKTVLTTLSFFPAALLWMYVSWAIAIYGLEVAYVVHHRTWRSRGAAAGGAPSGTARDTLALAALVEVSSAFDDGVEVDRPALADRLGAPEDDVADVVANLSAAGLVAETDGVLRPARGAAGVLAAEVVAALRGGPAHPVPGAASGTIRAAAEYLARLDREGSATHGATTVADLVRESRREPGA